MQGVTGLIPVVSKKNKVPKGTLFFFPSLESKGGSHEVTKRMHLRRGSNLYQYSIYRSEPTPKRVK